MTQTVRADFFCDFTCPWSVIGMRSLLKAFFQSVPRANGAIRFQPFELNPEMGPNGANLIEHGRAKYNESPAQYEATWTTVKAQGAALNFTFNNNPDSRIWNTFDAHRLMNYATMEGKGVELAHTLFKANFTEQRSISDHAVLLDLVRIAGLDVERARAILNSEEFGLVIRTKEDTFLQNGFVQVPTVMFDDHWVINGAQSTHFYEQAIRSILSGEVQKPT